MGEAQIEHLIILVPWILAWQSQYNKHAVLRRDAGLGIQRSQLLKEIVRYKEEITRLQLLASQSEGTARPVGGDGKAEDRRSIYRMQAEAKEVRKECERLIMQVASLDEQISALEEQVQQVEEEGAAEVAAVIQELSEAKNRILELEHAITTNNSAPSLPPLCKECSQAIQEPMCSACHAVSNPKAQEQPSAVPKDKKKTSLSARFTGKARVLGRLAAAAKDKGAAKSHATVAEPAGTTPTPDLLAKAFKPKAWSFEKDIEAWKAHCEKDMAAEREAFKLKLEAKDSDIVELMHYAMEGREQIYDQLAQIERNYWEPQLIDAKHHLRQISLSYKRLCQVRASGRSNNSEQTEQKKMVNDIRGGRDKGKRRPRPRPGRRNRDRRRDRRRDSDRERESGTGT